jgi:two-component system OmpR family response regulator
MPVFQVSVRADLLGIYMWKIFHDLCNKNEMVKPKKILIIDDEEDYCLLMGNFFERNNCEVHIAHTLGDGIKILSHLQPDIIFLDNNLPDGFGWLHAKQIARQFPSVHVHLISAYENDDFELPSKDQFNIWEKPISFAKLEAVLK